MKNLSEMDLLKIQNLTRNLFEHYEAESIDKVVDRYLNPMTKKDSMRNIKIAEQEIIDG